MLGYMEAAACITAPSIVVVFMPMHHHHRLDLSDLYLENYHGPYQVLYQLYGSLMIRIQAGYAIAPVPAAPMAPYLH